jgi:3-(3-hydroxy-phenyl)propionate hydroxylase
MAMTDTDVLIVGAGPTGLLLANLLGTMGVRTIIIERNGTTVDAPRAVSIDDESVRALQAVGLSDSLQSFVQKGYGSIYKGPSGRVFATVKPDTRMFGFEKRNAFQQPDLEAMLHSGLTRFENVDLRFNCELIAVSQSDNFVEATIQTSSGSGRLLTQYMVACDGGSSPARKMLGISLRGATFEEPWLIVDLATTRNRGFHTEVFCNPARPCITLPGPGGIRRYEFKLNKGETIETAEDGNFVRSLLSQFGPDSEEPIRRKQVYTFHARTAEYWRQGRILLAGDAAHLTPPFAGQGLNSGLRDAHNLAWKLHETIRSGAKTDLLDSYETERKPHAQAMIDLALRMGRIMMPTSPFQGALVRGGFHMLGLVPAARDYFAQMKYKPKPRFQAGLIVEDGKSASRTIVGSLMPQPTIEKPDGVAVLLDELLPDRPVVLVYADKPEQMLSETEVQMLSNIGVGVFGLTPEWTKAQHSYFATGRDANRLLASPIYLGYLNHFILLRRDRYVAATSTGNNFQAVRTAIKRISTP